MKKIMKHSFFTWAFLAAGLLVVINHPAAGQSYNTPGVYSYTVPEPMLYTITTIAGSGGGSCSQPGRGAKVISKYLLNTGDVLTLMVGTQGGTSATTQQTGGGGGASAVILNATHVLVVAGAGGGCGNDEAGKDGVVTNIAVVPCTGGVDCGGPGARGGGGGGFGSDGLNGSGGPGGKKGTLTNIGGGGGPSTGNCSDAVGGAGWGGGGGGFCGSSGGGGGGYKGGSGASVSGGRGGYGGISYVNINVAGGMLISVNGGFNVNANGSISFTIESPCGDVDGDGFTDASCGGTDCDDNDNTVYPGAIDICDNKDNNCDGITDEGLTGAPPPGWGGGNIGGAGNANSAFNCNSANPGGGSGEAVFNLSSQGFSGAGNADLINSNYQQKCGDASITAHIVGNPAPGWAGIYIREDLSAGSRMVAMKTNLSNFLRREIRTTTNGNKATSQSPLYAGNTWMRIVRTGNAFTFYTSPNGTAWAFFGSTTIAMNSCVYLGLFAESINGATMVNASFDNVAITGGAAPLVAAPNLGFEAQEELQTPDFGIYPNPTNGALSLDLAQFQSKAIQIEVYSLQGQLLQTTAFKEAPFTAQLDLSAYQNGMYLVTLKAEGLPNATKRVVLQR